MNLSLPAPLLSKLAALFNRVPVEPESKPVGLSDETKRRLMFAGLSAGSREQSPLPRIVNWHAMRNRNL